MPGFRYPLRNFFKDRKYASHHSCFKLALFDYNGESDYNGTLFRFPLRTGGYTSTIINETRSIEEIKSALFVPLIEGGEHLLPFLKYIDCIQIWEKVNNKVTLIHSVGVAEEFKNSLRLHRNEITLFADEKQYHEKSCLFVTLFPIDTNGRNNIWLVMNLLGFGAPSPASSNNDFYKFYCKNTLKYIPWVGIAFPTGVTTHITEEDHTWKFEWQEDSVVSLFEDIKANINLSLLTDICLDTDAGKYYCFLPIPKQSLFPFHIHGYFALDDNRKSLKWPSSSDRSIDSEWNLYQTEKLCTVLYATFLYISIQSLSHSRPAEFHYKLMADYNIHEKDDSLFSIVQREGLRLLVNENLVYSQALEWIPLSQGLYPPSVLPGLRDSVWTADTESSCVDLLLTLSEPIVQLPSNVIQLISKYEFLEEEIKIKMLSPAVIREIIKSNSENELCSEFLADRGEATNLLRVVLWDLDPSDALELEGLPLIITADINQSPKIFSTSSEETLYISEITPQYKLIFPGLECMFIDPSLPDEIHNKLLQISRSETGINLQDITNIQPATFSMLLSRFLDSTFQSDTAHITWTPGCNNQPKANWVKCLWEFIGTNSALISATEHLPILPKDLLSHKSIRLLCVRSEECPYIEFDATREPTDIERMLQTTGCELCHRHFFIQCFEEFVERPVPHCLTNVLSNEDILSQFVSLLSETNISLRRQLIELLNSISIDNEGERDIIKSLPIFLNFKGCWNSLDCQIGERSPVLAPRTIPDDIDYPAHILTPYDSILVILYQKLNVSCCNEKEFIQTDMVPYMISKELQASPDTRNLLALWILDQLPSLQLTSGDELLEFLRDTKWFVDSSTPCDKVGPVKLFKPSGMLNPKDPILKQLIDRSNEGFFPNEIYDDRIEKMKKYFEFKSYQDLNSRLRKEVCKATVANLKVKKNHGEWMKMFNALLEFLSFYFEDCELKDQESLWKEFSKPFVLPQEDLSSFLPRNQGISPSKKLHSPSEVIWCTVEQIPLLVYVNKFITYPSTSGDDEIITSILSCMGYLTDIPCDCVVNQLNYIVDSHQTCEFPNLYRTMSIIYTYLDSNSTSPCLSKLEPNFIFVTERGEFIEIREIIETTAFNLRPYLYSYTNLGYNCCQLFKSLGMTPKPTADQYCTVLQTVYARSNGKPISSQDTEIVIYILEALSDLDFEDCEIYILGYDEIMYPLDEEKLVFSQETWLDRRAICSEFPFVFIHELISRQTATSLGIKSFYQQFVTTQSYTTLDEDTTVIHGLQRILELYSEEMYLVREMLQNSDDSGASQFKILFDFRTHSSYSTTDHASLLSSNLHHWQGPAIWFYNDKLMQESDFDNLLCINGEGKSNDVTKLGRDGRGFCSAFYLTDLPSVVSGDKLYMIDPHMEYTDQSYGQTNSCKIDFCNNKYVRFYKDQFEPYQDVFGCNILGSQFYNSTLFRIPLRRGDIKSQLSVRTYDRARMEQLQKKVIKYVEDVLLFTENINLIEISELTQDTFTHASHHVKPIYCIRKESEKPQSFPIMEREDLERSVQGESTELSDFTFECTITSPTFQSPKRWLLCYTSGSVDELAEVTRKMCDEDLRVHAPFTTVAFDLDRLMDCNTNCESCLFSLYPLSQRLQLPYHCNGMFELDPSKMTLFSENTADLRNKWNTLLICHNLTNAVLNLYSCIANRIRKKNGDPDLYSQFLFRIFSKEMCNSVIWKDFCTEITHKLMESSLELFAIIPSNGDSWSCFSEVVILHEKDLKDKIADKYFNEQFIGSIKSFLTNTKSFKLASLPSDCIEHSGLLDLLLEHAETERIIDTESLVELFFESLPELPKDILMSILPALIASHSCTPNLTELIANTPCILCGDTDTDQLRNICDVIDPNNPILSDLYYPEENRIPSSRLPLFSIESSCYDILKNKFSLNSSILTLTCLIDRVEKIEREANTALAEKLLVYLNQDTFNNSDSGQIRIQLASHKFLPTLHDYELSSPHPRLASPDEVVVYPLRHFLSLQRCVLPQSISGLQHAIKLLEIAPNSTNAIETSSLLLEIVRCEECYENLTQYSELLLEKMIDIYGELSKRLEKDKSSILEKLKHNCIYIPDVGFVAPDNVIFSHEVSFSPYIHSVKHLYSSQQLKQFFLAIGVKETLTLKQCLNILLQLMTDEKLTPTELDLAIKLIVELSNRLFEEIGKSSSESEVLLLGEDGCIHNCSESIFYDLKWKEKEEYRSQIKINNKPYYFVHPQISNTNAHKLGAISLSSSITTVANKRLKFDYEIKGQREKITNRLRDIVTRYEAPVEVFKELLQNADDAKAQTVKFLFDYTSSYNCTSLINPEMEMFQGPSLYVYNDKKFSEDDFKSILEIGGETKKTDTSKIGRFGLGFNTIYHLTDVPSFVSSNYVHILDPHRFCNEQGLKIDFTSNQEIIQEYYFDQFSVYNGIFGCDVFTDKPYDATLFRFPFRTSKVNSEIKKTGMFDSSKDIDELERSFLDIIELVIYFLQYVQNIEVYERRDIRGEIKLVSRVRKTYKFRPYPEPFLTHHREHFKKLVACEREDNVSSIEIIEICSEYKDWTSRKEYILSHASGTGECIDVIKESQELKQAFVLPVAAVGIPRELIHQPELKKKGTDTKPEEYRIFCFLPIPKKSPYNMHVNGYFQLSSYRNELHITEENTHLTKWNCSLVNDALPNALIALLLHIREELLPPNSSVELSDQLLENFYSYFPLPVEKDKPWAEFHSKTIGKIISADAAIFPCRLHENKWLGFKLSSFLITSNISGEFLTFVKRISAEIGVYFIDLPTSYITKHFFKELFKKSDNSYDLKRLCENILFPKIAVLNETSLEDLHFVVSNLLQIYSQCGGYLNSEKSPLSNLAFIPCGDIKPVLRVPSEVVHPESKFSRIFYSEDKRLPHKDFKKLFTSTYTGTLNQLSVIKDTLGEKDLIGRCEVAQTVYSEDPERGSTHSMVIIEYINTCESKSIPDRLSEIAFIPVWEDPLYVQLNCRDKPRLVSPDECYSYSCRYLITHKYFAANEEVSKLDKCLKWLKIGTSVEDPEMLIELLEVLNSKQEMLREIEEESFDDRMKQVYRWLANFCFPPDKIIYSKEKSESKSDKKIEFPIGDKQEDVKDRLKNKQWIWHPLHKQFYLISQVKTTEYLSFKSKFLISFPYPDLFTLKENNLTFFFEFMGMKPEVGHVEAIEILSKMKEEYQDEKLNECDVKLALKLIDLIGKYYEKRTKTPTTEEIFLLSENDCLHVSSSLYRNDISWMESSFSEADKERIVHKYVPNFIAHILGAKSKRSTYYEDQPCEGIQMEDFGPNEAISDRIENIKTQLNCDVTILNELLQNAEDAGATEIAFILDEQTYPSDHLCFPSDTHSRWGELQRTPSLLVYNDQPFTERDLIGIQKVGIGGKKSRQTIGRFGIGFNSVYHLTRSPCLLTAPSTGDTTTFCIFDPYREYLNISKTSELPGKMIRIRNDRKGIFKDQLKPYELSPITDNPDFSDTLVNLRSEKCYSLFRFPLTAKHITKQKTDDLLEKLLVHSKRILLFLKHIKRIDIISIDKNGKVIPKGTMISDTSAHPTIPSHIPDFHKKQYLRDVTVTFKNITTKTWSAGRRQTTKEIKSPESSKTGALKMKKHDVEWLCYNHEQPIVNFPGHEKFQDKIETEKLRTVFGNLALDITNIGKREACERSYLYCFLPLDSSLEFPVHINAPLIVEQDRRHLKFSEKGQEANEERWEYTWHMSVIRNVLVPLYAKLILDMSDIETNPTGIKVKPADYYNWYYSLFPNANIQHSINSPFFNAISKELYTLLHETRQNVLIGNELEKFSFIGDNQGVFADSGSRLDYLKLPLHQVKYPLTNAPASLISNLKILDLDYQVVDPIHFLSYLIKNKSLLGKQSQFPCQMNDSVLTKKEVIFLLKFILKAEPDKLKELSEIPLKIDSQDILCNFCTREEEKFQTFRPTYSSLIPQCSSSFLSPDYESKIMNDLAHHNFIRDLTPEYLATKFVIAGTCSTSCCQLFWKFALEECKSIDMVIQLFGKHVILPVCHKGETEDTKSLYPLNQLCYVVSEDLEKSTLLLYQTFKKFDCPFLDVSVFKERYRQEVLSFLNKKAICKDEQMNPELLMGCLSHAKILKGKLDSEEAQLLRKFLSGMQNAQLQTPNIAQILSNLRIFVTINGTLKSVSEISVCFVNEHNFEIEKSLSEELEGVGIGIFSADPTTGNPISLIEFVADQAKIKRINTDKFVCEFILPQLVKLDVESQKKYLISISKLDQNVEKKALTQLQITPFIKEKSDQRVRADELYLRSVPMFRLCLGDRLLPSEWGKDSVIINILTKIGLNNQLSLRHVRDCAMIVEKGEMTETDADKFISLFVEFMRYVKFSQQDTQIVAAISKINFIPIRKIKTIESQQIIYENEIGNLLSAIPHFHLPYCGTQNFIHHESISEIYLKFVKQSSPLCDTVLQHLYFISQQCQQLSPDDNSDYEYLFHGTYAYLQTVLFPAKQLDYRCIMFNGTLYKRENLVFDIPEEIPPYLFKVPPPLSKFKQFLLKVGVQEKQTYKHYASVLKCISSQCNPTHELRDKQMAKSAKIAFSTMVSIFRNLPPGVIIDLDRADIYVLTDRNLIEPCTSVFYADNTSLLAKVRKYPRIQIHILVTLTPDANGSGVPPVQLHIQNLSNILIPSLSGNITNYQSQNQNLAKQYSNVLKSQLFHRALMRLYYHETKKNIIHLKAKDGKLYYSENIAEYPELEGFLPVLELVNKLEVICVRQIDIDLLDQRTNDKVCIPDIQCGYIDANSSKLYIKSDVNSAYQLPKTVAQELNSFLSKIFSKTISDLTNCFITQLRAIMSEFDEQNIISCPFLDQIQLPQNVPAVAPPTVPQGVSQTAVKSSSVLPSGPVTLSNLTSHRSHAAAQRSVCPRAGVDASRPDPSAAKLWIRTAQCDWRAANKLVRKSEEESSLFPPQACFLCFEATMKALIAFLHLSGGCSYELYFERNLCILLEEAKERTVTEATRNRLDELIIPLMNYDEQTRLPCLTSGMGFYTPRDCFTLEMSRGAVKSVRQVLNKLKDATREMEPNLESLMIEEGEGGFIENSCLSLKEILYCKFMITTS